MASVSTYLNFDGTTEEAFEFYKSVFGTEYEGQIARLGDMPADPSQPVPDHLKNKIININLPITAGHILRGADIIHEFGHNLVMGNNSYICLDPESREEADRIFAALSEGGQVQLPLTEMFWGDYFGSWADKYGVQWMINCTAK